VAIKTVLRGTGQMNVPGVRWDGRFKVPRAPSSFCNWSAAASKY